MAESIYTSRYTGTSIDNAVEASSEAITEASFNQLLPAEMPLNKIYMVYNTNTNATSLYRSTGSEKILISSGGGGGGGGGNIIPYTNILEVPASSSRLVGLGVGQDKYIVTNITITNGILFIS